MRVADNDPGTKDGEASKANAAPITGSGKTEAACLPIIAGTARDYLCGTRSACGSHIPADQACAQSSATGEHLGGLARFTGWNGPTLTDSGGYQVSYWW